MKRNGMWDACVSLFSCIYQSLVWVTALGLNLFTGFANVLSWFSGSTGSGHQQYREGDRVYVYSASLKKWFTDGVVDHVCTITNAHTFAPQRVEVGSVHVQYDRDGAFKWVRPNQRASFLRPNNTGLSAATASSSWGGLGSIFGGRQSSAAQAERMQLEQFANMTTPGFKLIRNKARLQQHQHQFPAQRGGILPNGPTGAGYSALQPVAEMASAQGVPGIRTVYVTEKPFGFRCTMGQVVYVRPGSLAARNGIRVGDVMRSVDGKFVNKSTFSKIFSETRPPFMIELQQSQSQRRPYARQPLVPQSQSMVNTSVRYGASPGWQNVAGMGRDQLSGSPALSDSTLNSLLNDANMMQAGVVSTPLTSRVVSADVSAPSGTPAFGAMAPQQGGIIQNISNMLGVGQTGPTSGQVVEISGMPSGILGPNYRQLFLDALNIGSARPTNAIAQSNGNIQVTYNQHITDMQRQQVEEYVKCNLGGEYNVQMLFLGQQFSAIQGYAHNQHNGHNQSFSGGVAVGTNLSVTQFDNTKRAKVIAYDPSRAQQYCLRYLGVGDADEWVTLDASTGQFTDKFACTGTFGIMAGNENVNANNVSEAVMAEYKRRLQQIYQNMNKLGLLPSVLDMLTGKHKNPTQNYQSRPHSLYVKVCSKYQIPPEAEFTGYNALNNSCLNSSVHNSSLHNNSGFQVYQDPATTSNVMMGSPFPGSHLGARRFFEEKRNNFAASPLLATCRKLSTKNLKRVPLAPQAHKPWNRINKFGTGAPRKPSGVGMFSLSAVNENERPMLGQVLPPGWTKRWSASQKEYYYWNKQTGETKWEIPG